MHLALFAFVLASTSPAEAIDVPPIHPGVRLFGRVLDTDPAVLRWSWSGSGVSISFTGTACSLRLAGAGAIYGVWVDGEETAPLDLTKSVDSVHALASGLPNRAHTIEIRQRTEASRSVSRFRGFRIAGRPDRAPKPPPRRIAFYGNSITCGYGILDTSNANHYSLRTQDEGRTFAALAARSLGAERSTVCWSGRGVLRNIGRDTVQPTIPRLHRRILPDDTLHLWDFARWTPHVVVIDLGTNDFSGGAPDSTRFHQAFGSFLDTLRGHHPKARFVLVDGPMMSDDYPVGARALSTLKSSLDAVVAAANARGIQASRLSLTPQSPRLGYGADWHPNQAQARLNGQELTAHLQALVGWSSEAGRR